MKAQLVGGPRDGEIVVARGPEIYFHVLTPLPRAYFAETGDPPLVEPLTPRCEVYRRRYGDDGELFYVHADLLKW